MATVVDDWRGVVIELDHGETANFLNVLKTAGGGVGIVASEGDKGCSWRTKVGGKLDY